MDKKSCGIYTKEYYSAIKRNTSESVLMRQMNLEPIAQGEAKFKREDKYHILTQNIEYRDGMDEHLQGSSGHRERTNLWTRLGGREERSPRAAVGSIANLCAPDGA